MSFVHVHHRYFKITELTEPATFYWHEMSNENVLVSYKPRVLGHECHLPRDLGLLPALAYIYRLARGACLNVLGGGAKPALPYQLCLSAGPTPLTRMSARLPHPTRGPYLNWGHWGERVYPTEWEYGECTSLKTSSTIGAVFHSALHLTLLI